MNGNWWWLTYRPTDSSKEICPPFLEGGHKKNSLYMCKSNKKVIRQLWIHMFVHIHYLYTWVFFALFQNLQNDKSIFNSRFKKLIRKCIYELINLLKTRTLNVYKWYLIASSSAYAFSGLPRGMWRVLRIPIWYFTLHWSRAR